MNEKRFELRLCPNGNYYLYKNNQLTEIDFDKFNKESAESIVNLLNEQDNEIKQYKDNLRMCREKALYWRNKAENIFGDMKTNVKLQQENIRLKKGEKSNHE